jgi:hypothetical protein
MSLSVCCATESERADKVDRPLRRAILMIMPLRRLALISRSEPDWHDCSIHPPIALPRARVRRAWSILAKIVTVRS